MIQAFFDIFTCRLCSTLQLPVNCVTIRYDTIEEFNVDSKAEYTA